MYEAAMRYGVALVACILVACSESSMPDDTTSVASATGGVIGAGLGVIVGSQTGDPGTGLLLGSAAGAGTGYLVGDALSAEQARGRLNDERIARREAVIRSRREEINSLRTDNGDGMDRTNVRYGREAPHRPAEKAGDDCDVARQEFQKSRGRRGDAEALIALRRSVRLCPDNVMFKLGLAEAYRSSGRREDAESQYREVLRMQPHNAAARRAWTELE